MTTIAYRDGIIASDTQAYLGHGEPGFARKTKLHRLSDRSLVGISSSIVGAAIRLVPWIEAGCDYENMPTIKDADREMSFEILQVFDCGKLRY